MIEKIEFGVHPVAEAAGYEKMTTIIDIDLADGRTVSGRADFGKGSPTNPMSDDELADKFRECAAWGGLAEAERGKDRRSRVRSGEGEEHPRADAPACDRRAARTPAKPGPQSASGCRKRRKAG